MRFFYFIFARPEDLIKPLIVPIIIMLNININDTRANHRGCGLVAFGLYY
jgi:hypothetical protein